jgi:hypothetical protein
VFLVLEAFPENPETRDAEVLERLDEHPANDLGDRRSSLALRSERTSRSRCCGARGSPFRV